jgi:hypothetical protein
MSPFELARVSMETVVANKLRSGLTMLGVAIGSMAIILLLSLSLGMNHQITSVVEGLGSNLYLVLSGRQDRGGFAQGSRPTASVNNLRLQHAEKLQKESGHQVTVSPVFNVPTTISYGKTSSSGIFVMGAMPNFPKVRNWPVERGTFLRQTDVDLTRRVVAIGKTIETTLFEGADPLGKQLTIGGERFQVVGVMGSKGQLFDVDLDNQVFIPLSTPARGPPSSVWWSAITNASTVSPNRSSGIPWLPRTSPKSAFSALIVPCLDFGGMPHFTHGCIGSPSTSASITYGAKHIRCRRPRIPRVPPSPSSTIRH